MTLSKFRLDLSKTLSIFQIEGCALTRKATFLLKVIYAEAA